MFAAIFTALAGLFGGQVAKPSTPAKTTAPTFKIDNTVFMNDYDVQEKAKFVTAIEEGRSNRVYLDSRGFRTIGIGFNMQASGARTLWKRAGMKTNFDTAYSGRTSITSGEVDVLFSLSYAEALEGTRKVFPQFGSLGVWQKVALIGMVFQMGSGGVAQFKSTLGALARQNAEGIYSGVLGSLWARQTPARAKRAALMLAYNITHRDAEKRLVQAGQIKQTEKKYA